MIPFRSKKYQQKQRLEQEANNNNSKAISDAASQWILRREQLPEYRFAMDFMTESEKEDVFWNDWDKLDCFAQRDLVKATYSDQWYKLIACYKDLSPKYKAQVLEALGYIHNENVVEFLLQEMKRDDESIRIAASGAMKKQDPILTIEPMLNALNKPEVFLASRVFDVLKAIGPKLVPIILKKIETADPKGQIVMIQLLGTFGDNTVIPELGKLALDGDYNIRKVAVEALTEIGSDEIWPILKELMYDQNWQIRLLVVDAIEKHRLTQAYDMLKGVVKDEDDPLVRDMMNDLIKMLEEIQMPATFSWSRVATKREEIANGADGKSSYRSNAYRSTGRGGAFNEEYYARKLI